MELLMALDFITLAGAKAVLEEVGDSIDIVEIGTPFVVKEGIKAVEEIREAFPSLKIMADLKIMDAGEYETKMAFEAGADIVTVLGVADNATVTAAVEQGRKFNRSIMIDMISVGDVAKRAAEIDKLGADYICVHTAFDIQSTGKNPLDELQIVKSVVKNARTAVAGGIKLSTIGDVVRERPAIIIVGGGITGRPDRRKTALEMQKIMGK